MPPTIEERVAAIRAANPLMTQGEALRQATRIANDDVIEGLRAALNGVTMTDLIEQNAEHVNAGGGDLADPWGLDSRGIDYDAVLAERDAADEARRQRAEYEASDQYVAVEALRKSLTDAGWSQERIDATEGATHPDFTPKPVTKRAAKSDPNAPEMPGRIRWSAEERAVAERLGVTLVE